MIALITGASSGIGADMAQVLSQMGYDLILVARRRDLLEQLKQQLPTNVTVIATDLSVEESCIALFEQVKNEPVDIVINNAGFGLMGAFDKTDLMTELEMINVNVKAVHILTKLFLVEFKKRNHGFILNVSSAAGFLPGPLMSTYYASKAYVLNISQAIWEELRQQKSDVHISVLCPGPVPTDFNKKAKAKHISGKGLPSSVVAAYAIRQMFRKKRVIIPGLGVKLMCNIQRFIPMRPLLVFCYKRLVHKGALE